MTITAHDFPTSPLALRTTDPGRQAQIRRFAFELATAANRAAEDLRILWTTARTPTDRVDALRVVHQEVTQWRAARAVRGDARRGAGPDLGHQAARFRLPITVTNRNFDRIGYVGRVRDGATWDPDTCTYRGGRSTEAHRALLRFGVRANERFAREAPHADVLDNRIRVDARVLRGTRIVRGAEAQKIAHELAARVAARGLDASRMETGGDPIYTISPHPDDSTVLFNEALRIFAHPLLTPQRFRLARYLLFQAPQTKKGSDAVNRVFSVAVGAVALGYRAPTLPEDIDLRSYVLAQDDALR